LGRGGGYWDIVTYIISQYLIPAILYRDIIYALYCPSGGGGGGGGAGRGRGGGGGGALRLKG
jgi:hypothetical protein